LAKNLKLHIKNTQLADAIDLQGLKAKLSKKKEPSLSTEEETTVTKAKIKDSSENFIQENVVQIEKKSEPKEEFKPAPKASIAPETISPPVQKEIFLEKPVFSTFPKAEASISDLPAHDLKIPLVEEKAKPSVEKQKEVEKPKQFVQKSSPPAPIEEPVDIQKPFLSALRVNPENLGPVLSKKSPEKRQPEDRDSYDNRRGSSYDQRRGSQEPQQKLWEPLKTSQGSRYQAFSAHGRPVPPKKTPLSEEKGEGPSSVLGEKESLGSSAPVGERTPVPGREFGRDQERQPFERPEGNRSYGSRPPMENRPPYGSRPPMENRPPYGSRPPMENRPPYGSRPPMENRPPYGSRPPMENRPPYGSRPPMENRPPYGSRPPMENRPYGSRPPMENRPYGSRPPMENRPYGSRPPMGGSPFSKDAPPLVGEEEMQELRRKTLKDAKEKEKEKEKESRASATKRSSDVKPFDDTRLRRGISIEKDDEGSNWRKRRALKSKMRSSHQEVEIVRPKEISVRIPISLKDLAQCMKLKSSQLISNLFLSGVSVTLNDMLDDETMVQLLGQEFGCVINFDTVEEERLRITDKSIQDEIKETPEELLKMRPPIVAFMGHVDHGKTSIIDRIRKSNRVQSEVGAITQHIGAFICPTAHGPITILDTPGHEAFFQMRERGADVTDIVVLVVAGDEGIKEQTIEALNQAKGAHSTIVVAINKCDKQGYDEGLVFRQLAENNLLPEAWGGQTVTVKCSASTGEGIDSLLEMLALQSEVLELKANPAARARGSIIETEMNKGMGAVATLLIRNGTLHLGDSLVFETSFAKVKSMRDEWGKEMAEAGPSYAVRIHGLSSMPSAGEEFIVVPNEREAREIAEGRLEGKRHSNFQIKRRKTIESMMEQASQIKKKIFNVIIRADVQGSLEALCHALGKITSDKIELNIIATGIGEISESDVQMAMVSKAIIIGYHTQVEAHAEHMIKEAGVQIRLHNIIYHAHDDVKALMTNALDKIREETYKGKAEVKTLFKSSHLGNIAGCMVIDGSLSRNSHVRVRRLDSVVFDGTISSLKRFKEDVREVTKGTECGIVINNWDDSVPGDIIEAFDISYRAQEL
jgi:translation initiation factor IF-2